MNELEETNPTAESLDELARRSDELQRRSLWLNRECDSQRLYLQMLHEQSRLLERQSQQLFEEIADLGDSPSQK